MERKSISILKSPDGYLNPYVGGVILGIVLFLAFFLTGNGLGASGAINRVQVYVEDIVAPGHVDKTAYLSKLAGGDRNPLDSPSVFMLIGTFLGGMASGAFSKRLKFEIRKGPRINNTQRLIFALIGGIIMGYGARLSRGCTSGQALSGGAVLSVGSWAFMFSVFIGGYALAYFVRKLWR